MEGLLALRGRIGAGDVWRPWLALRGGLDWPYLRGGLDWPSYVEALAGLTRRP